MNNFRNILFLSDGIAEDIHSLKQAFSLTRNNKATLTLLVIYPELPKSLISYHANWQQALQEKTNASVQNALAALNMNPSDITVNILLESSNTPATDAIRQVLRNDHDLLVKSASPAKDKKGFKALDMDLLRKCPCPVWLCRPIEQSRQDMQVAVAIDPEVNELETSSLANRLLSLSRSLADTCSGKLHVISCWDFAYEGQLRNHPFIKVADSEILKTLRATEDSHRLALNNLIAKAAIGGVVDLCHRRGNPEQVIPDFVEEKNIDVLVMGTVARTGIPGFIMGNTAENIVQTISCSLLALKPNGFVSPVKAY